MKMKKSKKVKGMTLVECIVALAVLGVFTASITTAATSLSAMKITSNNVIKQTSYEAPTADNRNTSSSVTQDEGVEEIKVTVEGVGTVSYSAKRYTALPDDDEDEVAAQQRGLIDGTNRNFQFYVLES